MSKGRVVIDQGEHLNLTARRLARAGLARPLEQAGAVLRRLSASDAVAERGADVEGAHARHRLDPHLGLRHVDRVAAARADAQRPDALHVHVGVIAQEVHRAPDVLRSRRGELREVRLAAALALVGGVEDQGDEALPGQQLGVGGRDLLLDGAEGMGHHDRRAHGALLEVFRPEQIADNRVALVLKGNSFHL